MSTNNPRHSRFFWRSSAMFGILDFERQFKEVNSAWEKTLGLSTSQLLAKRFLDFVHPDDCPSTQYYLEQLDEGMPSVSFSSRFRHNDSHYRNVLWEINCAASVEYAYYIVGMDITNREQPMVADEMINVLQEGVILQYANGTIGACNPSAERILGLSADQMMGWTLIDPDWRAIHEDGSPFPTETHPAICTLRTGQSYADVVMGVVKSDESVIWIRIHSYPLWRDDVTTPYAVVISFSDVTQYKETEFALRKNSMPSSSIIPENNYDLWDWDLVTNEVHFSPRWEKMLGFEEHELLNHIDTWHQRIHTADYNRVMTDIQNHLNGLTAICENTHRLQHKDGSYRWILSRSVMVRDAAGKPHHMVGTHVDITEPRRIEDELNDTEKKYQQVTEVESDAIFMVDANTFEIMEANKSAALLYGYSRSQLLNVKKDELSAQPEKTAKLMKKGMKSFSTQYHKKQDGTVFPVEVTSSPFLYQGQQVLMIAVRDLTDRQKLETALWESESKYRQLFEAASNPTIVFDANTQQIFDVNQAAIDLYGYGKEEWLHMTTEEVSAEPGKKRGAFGSGNKRMQVIPLRWHKKRDGTVFPVEISTGNSYLFQGRSLVCATLRDITERKAHEEALRQERDFVKTLVQASPAFFFAINPDGKIRMMNKAMLQATEFLFDEVANCDFLTTFVPSSERPLVFTEFENLIKSMQPSLMECHVLGKSGQSLLVEWHSRAVVKANGTLDYFFGVGIDVTERKKAQGHLRLFKSIIESSDEAIAVSNTENQLVYINPAYEKLFEKSIKENKALSFTDNYTNESLDIWEQEIQPALALGKSWEGELEVFSRDGFQFPIWQRVDAVRDTKGNMLFCFGLMHDISERKRMWETLRKQWEEYQMIFNSVPAMIWYRDKDNHLLRKNKRAEETFKDHEEAIEEYTDCQEIIQSGHPQYGVMCHLKRGFNDEFIVNGGGEEEIPSISHQDSSHWLQFDKIPYRDAQGNITGIIVFAIDITEHKKIQNSIPINEQRMRLVVENMPFMLKAIDTKGNIVAWNRACEKITGYSADEIIGNSNALEKLYPETTDRSRILTQANLKTTSLSSRSISFQETDTTNTGSYPENSNDEPILTLETKITCKNGHLKMLTWSSVSKQFPIPGWQAWFIGQNITSHDSAEQPARKNEELLVSMFEVARLAMCLTDDRGRFLRVNQAYAQLYGYRPEELVGQPFTMVLPPATHNEAVREYYSLLMTHEVPTVSKRREDQHRNGYLFEVQIMASRILVEGKRPMLVSIVTKWIDK